MLRINLLTDLGCSLCHNIFVHWHNANVKINRLCRVITTMFIFNVKAYFSLIIKQKTFVTAEKP